MSHSFKTALKYWFWLIVGILLVSIQVYKYVPNAVSEDSAGILSVNYTAVLVAQLEVADKRIKDLEDRLLRYEN